MKERLRWMSRGDVGVGEIPPGPPLQKGGEGQLGRCRPSARPPFFPPFLKGGRGDLATAGLPNRLSHDDCRGLNPALPLGRTGNRQLPINNHAATRSCASVA